MRELPFDLRFTVGDHAVHLLHGSPRKVPGIESVEATIERVTYDIAAVADEVRRAGQPGEFADKLMLAT